MQIGASGFLHERDLLPKKGANKIRIVAYKGSNEKDVVLKPGDNLQVNTFTVTLLEKSVKDSIKDFKNYRYVGMFYSENKGLVYVRRLNRERFKLYILFLLVITSFIQVGILCTFQNQRVPTNFMGFFNKNKYGTTYNIGYFLSLTGLEVTEGYENPIG